MFFCNSGAEANEGMVKMIRRANAETGTSGALLRVICFDGAFHGRTLAMLAPPATPNTCRASARWWTGSTTFRSAT
ncbi:MAG: aminotransferase class III-fold pyridoxal phosphate-dependent enzyme [Acetobacteraceae bacterium]